MSPVSRKRKSKKDSKRPGSSAREDRALFDPVYAILDRTLRPTLESDDPFDPELVIAELLGTMRGAEGVEPGVATDVVDALIDDLAGRPTVIGAAALALLASQAPDAAARERARRRLQERPHLQELLPAWADALGRWQLGRVLVAGDVFGDQTSLVLEFTGAGASSRHALVACVDFNYLGGWCDELFIADDVDDVFTSMVSEAAGSDILWSAPLDPAAARALIGRALEATDVMLEPELDDDFQDTHSLALARLRLLPAVDGPAAVAVVAQALRAAGLHVPSDLAEKHDEDDDDGLAREQFVQQFLGSPDVAALEVATDSIEYLARLLVRYGADVDDGRVLRVSPDKLAMFLVGWLPRTVLLDEEDLAALPPVLGAWTEFAARESHLPDAAISALRAALFGLLDEYAEASDDPEHVGTGGVG